ncbi:MAG: type IV pilus biogenesis/stability protein PilW [Gammaproteobacteria bacterium]|nr:type IV pilus biogenesis/stability protein PilW [Gammaproteobacteria bacterium]
MRIIYYVAGLLFILISSGCTTQTSRVGVDNKKVSIANTELGVAYLRQGKYKVAMHKLKKALEHDDDNANAHHYIAELYRRLEQNELADKHFKEALDHDEENSSLRNNYGIFLCGIGSYEKGLKYLNQVLLDPLYSNKGQAYENMGICVEKQGNVKKAEQYYISALKFNMNSPSALLGLAQIEFDKRNVKLAAEYLNRHNKIARATSQSLWLGLIIARKQGFKGKAGSLAIKIKQYFPDSKEAKYLEKLKIR